MMAALAVLCGLLAAALRSAGTEGARSGRAEWGGLEDTRGTLRCGRVAEVWRPGSDLGAPCRARGWGLHPGWGS